jgi:hypothetical protein
MLRGNLLYRTTTMLEPAHAGLEHLVIGQKGPMAIFKLALLARQLLVSSFGKAAKRLLLLRQGHVTRLNLSH